MYIILIALIMFPNRSYYLYAMFYNANIKTLLFV